MTNNQTQKLNNLLNQFQNRVREGKNCNKEREAILTFVNLLIQNDDTDPIE